MEGGKIGSTPYPALADAPDPELLAAVHRHGGRTARDLVLDHALVTPERDPDARLRNLMLIDRIRVLQGLLG